MLIVSNYSNLKHSLNGIRENLVRHPVYSSIHSIQNLRVFLEHHIFAVWDFMSLLKSLQRQLTCVEVPWTPRGHNLSRRLINEIVLAEESDELGDERFSSHFELYHAAMVQCGADTRPIDAFIRLIEEGIHVNDALVLANAPLPCRAFVGSTMEVIQSGKVHQVAASFTLGREDLIPDMFRALIKDLHTRWPGQLTVLIDYLERHIQLDEEHHTPMALRMLDLLCEEDPLKLFEVEEGAKEALRARLALWDGVLERFGAVQVPGPMLERTVWS